MFVRGFETIQELVKKRKILAGHDISDGGLIVALLEMAFAGNIQLEADFNTSNGNFKALKVAFF